MRARLFKNGIKVKDAKYPRLDMAEIINLEDGLEWKLFVEGERPDYNELETIERVEVDNDNLHPDYPHLKVIDIVYTAVKRSDEDIINMINGYENNSNEQLIGNDKLKLMFLYMSIINRKLDGLTISAKMQKVLDKGDEKAVKIWKNDTKLKSKLKDLSDGKNVNLKTGWTNE